MTTLREQLIALMEPELTDLGYELLDVEFVSESQGETLRVFIDRPKGAATVGVTDGSGVDVEDCARVSRAISALLDVADPIASAYTLEVSSPGSDRRLRTRAHFERFVGARIRVELAVARAGRRRYTGLLAAVDEAGIRLEVDEEEVAVPLAEIGEARLAS